MVDSKLCPVSPPFGHIFRFQVPALTRMDRALSLNRETFLGEVTWFQLAGTVGAIASERFDGPTRKAEGPNDWYW